MRWVAGMNSAGHGAAVRVGVGVARAPEHCGRWISNMRLRLASLLPVRAIALAPSICELSAQIRFGFIKPWSRILDPMVVGAAGCVAEFDLIKADGGRSDG
jgi:hypothetical protein